MRLLGTQNAACEPEKNRDSRSTECPEISCGELPLTGTQGKKGSKESWFDRRRASREAWSEAENDNAQEARMFV